MFCNDELRGVLPRGRVLHAWRVSMMSHDALLQRTSRRTVMKAGLAFPALAAFGSAGAQESTPAPNSGDWPIYRYNPARTGEGPGPGVAGGPVQTWRAQLPGPAG